MYIIPKFLLYRIKDRPNLSRAIVNIGWLLLDKILRMGVGVLVGIWMARYLGPQQFGLLSFAMAFVGIFSAIPSLGLQGIVVRDVLLVPEEETLTIGTSAILQLIAGTLAYLMLLGSIGYVRPDDTIAFGVTSILGSMMLFEASKVAVYWFEAKVESKYIVWVQNATFLTFAAIKIVLILEGLTLTAIVWASLGETIITSILMVMVMVLRGPALGSLRFSVHRGIELIRDSWPLMFSGMAVIFYMKIDQIMIGQMIGDSELGIYSAAARLSEIWYFIPMIISASVFPRIVDAKRIDNNLYKDHLQSLYDLMVVFSIAVAIPMTFLSEPIIYLLYGEEYSKAGTILSVHIWASTFVFFGVASEKWFIIENKQVLSLLRTFLGATINVALNFWLIPSFGAVGAAYATVISQAMAAFIFDLIFYETREMFRMKLMALNPAHIYRRICYIGLRYGRNNY